MYLLVAVIVLGLWSIGGQASDFTINSIKLNALPFARLRNGDTLELKCTVMVAKTTDFLLNSTITFYTDDKKIYTNSTTEDTVSYIIPKVRVSHSGLYKCEVSMASMVKTSEEVEIKVTGLSSPLINVSKTEVREGDDVTVRCEAPEEWSLMVFTFYKINQNGEEKKPKSSDTNHQEVKFMIKGGEEILHFKCDFQLVILGEKSPASTNKHVTVVAPFSTPRIEVLPSLNFTEGMNMSVKCSVQEGLTRLDDMKVTLQKDGHIINSSTTTTLSYFQVATVDDMGNYTCKVENKKTSKSSYVNIDIFELFPRPNLTLTKTNRHQYINEGDYITLKCSVAGLDSEVSNALDYKFIVNGGKIKFTRKGGKLFMKAIESHSGSYVCEVTKSDITKRSEPLNIQVYAPVKNLMLTYIMMSNKTVVLGDTLVLTCKCQFGTPPITYSLFEGNNLLENKTMQGNMEARFLVNSSWGDAHDLRKYTCKATNRNAQSAKKSDPVHVTVVIPISRVELKAVPSSGDVEEGSELNFICRVSNGTIPIKFQFYKKKGNEIFLRNVTETNNLFMTNKVSTFSKQDDGTYFCVASNRAHKEVRSNYEDVRAVLATWKKGVISAFVLLIILAAIAICAYLHMDKKKKVKDISTEKNRSSKPVTTKNEKSTVEMKAGESYFGSVENEYLVQMPKQKTEEENRGNSQQMHEVEHTEAPVASPDAQQDTAENNLNSTKDVSEANNHS